MAFVAVLCHGCHLDANDWETVMWGKSGQLGRLPQTVLVCLQLLEHRKEIVNVMFGSAASQRDGVMEGEYIKQYLFDNFHRNHHKQHESL